MAVAKSKRGVSSCEYVHQANIVLIQIKRLMRRWPKSRTYDDKKPALEAAHECLKLAVEANTIYASVAVEYERKLTCLEQAYARLNYLQMLCIDWMDNPPQKHPNKKNVNERLIRIKPKDRATYVEKTPMNQTELKQYMKKNSQMMLASQPLFTLDVFKDLSACLYHAIGVFTGAIKDARKKYRLALQEDRRNMGYIIAHSSVFYTTPARKDARGYVQHSAQGNSQSGAQRNPQNAQRSAQNAQRGTQGNQQPNAQRSAQGNAQNAQANSQRNAQNAQANSQRNAQGNAQNAQRGTQGNQQPNAQRSAQAGAQANARANTQTNTCANNQANAQRNPQNS